VFLGSSFLPFLDIQVLFFWRTPHPVFHQPDPHAIDDPSIPPLRPLKYACGRFVAPIFLSDRHFGFLFQLMDFLPALDCGIPDTVL